MNKKNYNMRGLFLFPMFGFVVFVVLFSGCTSNQSKRNNTINYDSIKKANAYVDSLNYLNLKAKKTVTVSDKTITVIKNAQTNNELKFEYQFGEYNDYYKSKSAERNETFLIIRIKLFSKSKWNNGSGNFLPNLNVFRFDKSTSPFFIGKMTYQLYQDGERHFNFLEQIFDYKESEVFVCWLELNTPINHKYIISVNNPDKDDFDLNTVIGIINSK